MNTTGYHIEELEKEKVSKSKETELIPKKIKNMRILLVENDEDNKFIIKLILDKLGFEVVSACDGESALELFDKTVSLVILNIVLPDIEGLVLLNKLKGIKPNLRSIVIDDLYNKEITEDIIYLKRPISSTKLLNAINKAFIKTKLSNPKI